QPARVVRPYGLRVSADECRRVFDHRLRFARICAAPPLVNAPPPDGVWDEIEDDHAVRLVGERLRAQASGSRELDLHAAAALLRDASYGFGSDDNISVMVVSLKAQ